MSLLFGRLGPLSHGGDAVQLQLLPQSLSLAEIVRLILIFIGRQVLYVLGLSGQTNETDNAFEAPPLQINMPFKVSKQDLKNYAQAVELDSLAKVLDSSVQPCLLLCALSMPSMLLLLAHPRSPIRPLGSVNVRNTFELLRPELCSEDQLLNLENGEVHSKFLPQTRKVKRGLEIDLSVEVLTKDDGKAVVIFRQTFTMLQFVRFKKQPTLSKQVEGVEDDQIDWSKATTASVSLSVRHPPAWAQICKDYNPIHMSNLLAKLFGFSSKISHGNFALAYTLVRLEAKNADFTFYDAPLTINVNYKRPIGLPARLQAESVQHAGTIAIRLVKHDKAYITASLAAAR